MPGLNDHLWKRYEHSVAELLAGLDARATVEHDQRVKGRLSHAKRQIDVLVKGRIVDIEIVVAVECKRLKRPAEIGVVDSFIGKLLDVGADRGVLYAFSGFTSAATARALGARNPAVMAIALETPQVVQDLHGVPGYPVDLHAQEVAPQWVEEVDAEAFRRFLRHGEWSKWWS
jgi:hypothetical protein